MSEFEPQAGDRVRVTFEADYQTATRNVHFFNEGSGSPQTVVRRDVDALTIEKIEPPVEVFKPGDTVRSKAIPQFTYLILKDGYVDLHNKVHRGAERFSQGFTSESFEKVTIE